MTYRFGLTTRILPLLAAFGLAACNDGVPETLPGGIQGGGVSAGADFAGIWDGAYVGNPPGDPEQWASTFTAMLTSGRLILFESNGQVWDGTFVLDGTARMHADDTIVYQTVGIRSTTLRIDGSVSGTTTLDMTYNLGTGIGFIQLQFRSNDAYNRGSSLAQLAGNWTLVNDIPEARNPPMTVAINAVNGQAVLDGANVAGCQFNGVIELIDADHNLYNVKEFVLTNGVANACDKIINITETAQDGTITSVPTPFPFAGDAYTGLATLLPTENTLQLVVTNGNDRSVAFRLARN